MRAHTIIVCQDHLSLQGNGNLFWWDVTYEYGKFILFSIWGASYGEFDSLKQLFDFIQKGEKDDYQTRPNKFGFA